MQKLLETIVDKFLSWFDRNRKRIGFTVGALCVLSAVTDIVAGDPIIGVLWLMVGVMIIVDARQM